MKRLILFLAVAVLMGCTCLSQIPDQVVVVDQNCQALLVDYRDSVSVAENCNLQSFEQSPAPGTIIDAANPFVDVTLTATDAFGNQDQIEFRVIAIDTIPPVITVPESMMAYTVEEAGQLMRATHYYMAHSIQQAVEARPDSALVQWPMLAGWDTVWDDYPMVTFSPKGGEGTYLGTFYPPGQYLCACDSSAYYGQMAGGTLITLNFE